MSGIENPPAFPRDERYLGHNGMSLRDWFAGQAMNGLLSSHAGIGYEKEAREAYRFADAMLSHRAHLAQQESTHDQ